MASFHQTIIVGNLGRDPELRHMPSGDAICNFSVAVTETWTDKASGSKKEQTTWYRVGAFGKLGEICSNYLKKGSQVMITGKMQSRKYTDKDGVERESWELKADQTQMLGGKPDGSQGGAPAPQQQRPAPAAPQRPAQAPAPAASGNYEDDIPF